MLVSSRSVEIRSHSTRMLDLIHVGYAVFCAIPADVVVVVGNKMATSNKCPMLKCIQDAIVQSLARYNGWSGLWGGRRDVLKGRIKTGRQPLPGSFQPRRGNRRLTSAKPSFSEQASQHHLLHPTFQTTWAMSRAVFTVSRTKPTMPSDAVSPSS